MSPVLRAGSGSGAGCLVLFALPFAGFGVFALTQSFREFSGGDWKKGFGLAVFGLIFCLVGFGLMLGARYGARKLKQESALRSQYPDEPWRWRSEWADGRISSNAKAAVIAAWIFACIWNGVSSFVVVALPAELRKGNNLALIGLVFPAAGIWLITRAVLTSLRWRRFGKSTFELASVPASPGGQLCGLVTADHLFREADDIQLRLVSIRRSRSGKEIHEHLLWEDEKKLEFDALRVTGGIPVVFDIPVDAEPSSPEDTLPCVIWRLEAHARMPGVDFAAQFDVPVFRVAGATAAAPAAPAEDPTAQWQKDGGQFKPDPLSKIRVGPAREGGTEFRFPAGRYPGVGLGLLLFTAIWTGSIWLALALKAPWIFPIVLGLFEVLFVMLLVGVWLGSSRLRADARGLEVDKRWGFFRRRFTVSPREVQLIEPRVGMTVGTKAYYDLRLTTVSGRRYTLATMIGDRREAEWLAERLTHALQ